MSLSPVGFGAHLIHIWRGVQRVLPKDEPISVPRVLPKVEPSSVPRVVPKVEPSSVTRVLPKVEPRSVTRVVAGRYGFRYGEGALTVL